MTLSPIAKPTPFGSGVALLAALMATASTVGISALATLLSLVGVLLFALGLVLPHARLLTHGSIFLGAGVIVAGVSGSPPLAVGIGFIGTVIAWDVSHHSLSLGRQIGADNVSAAPEAVHAATSFLLGGGAVGVGYLIFTATSTGHSATAVALLTLGVLFLIFTFR